MDSKELFYDSIAHKLPDLMTCYDTDRRIEVIFDDFLADVDISNKTLLDIGCGVGVFTRRAVDRGAIVTTADIGENLVNMSVKMSPEAKGLTASLPNLPIDDNHFDIVMSSETIEHTKDPYKSTEELIRVLKPGGLLLITVPNRSFWYWSLILANFLKIRPFEGYENWVHYKEFRSFLESRSMEIIEYKGIHLYPFVVSALNGILRKLDRKFDKSLGHCMVNIAACARKKG